MMAKTPRIAVIGAGVVGLTTALMLQKRLKAVQIDILANEFTSDTVSWVAAGIFRPSSHFTGSSEELTRAFVKDSWDYWFDIYNSSEGPNAGITMISGYMVSKDNPEIVRNRYTEDIVPEYRAMTKEELKICPGDWKYGSFSTTVSVENTFYQPWSQQRFLKNGGNIIQKKINSFDDVSDYDVVINCTGLGAKYLCNDQKMVPIRGQVLKVKAPWLKTFFYDDLDTYIIPGIEYVTLGGTRQFESYNKEVCKHDTNAILERCVKLVPALKNAPIIKEAVGLRPYRPEVRIEKEIVQTKSGKKVNVVHNYGHGGYGVTTAPGTSKHAIDLAIQMLPTGYQSKL